MRTTDFCTWKHAIAALSLWSLLWCPARAEEATHWSFRPVQRPQVPAVRHTDLIQSSIDAFLLEKLEAAGLEPAALADKRSLIRRATYDLTGLPPTPAEVSAFLADNSPDAFAAVVNRLLASPHYGERWGRHWLDVARYATTKGDTSTADPVYYYAFTYRDYVVRAFNEDLPYDRFLMEQIAADQLEPGTAQPSLAAMGFITLGRRFLGNGHDTIDDRIDVVTRGTMALTVSCARCHDHKFDPIPTADYYSLYGVFSSSNEPNPLPVIGTVEPAAAAAYQAERQKLESARDELTRKEQADVLQKHRRRTAEYLLMSRAPAQPATDEEKKKVEGKEAMEMGGRRAGSRRWKRALEKLNAESDPIFAPWFAFVALPEGEFEAQARELSTKVAANSLPHPVNPLVAAAFSGEPPQTLRDVARRYARLFDEAIQAPTQPAASAQESPPVAADPAREALRQIYLGDDAPGNLPENALKEFLPQKVQTQIQQFATELEQLELKHSGAPVRAMALADNPQPQNAKIFTRGNPNNPGAEVPRQFIQVVAGENRQPFAQGSGRLELARAIASPTNPLTARVLVNRVWLHHFGEGLVTTPDDFGLRSEAPTHPELLDYLAARFMDDGWSLKKLHRLLMLSHAYQRASDDGLRSEATDSENHLLSKMNRRRLGFEEVRDTLLFVAGNLDETIGGRAVELVPQPKVAAAGNFIGIGDQPPSRRRAIYGHIDRQNLPGLFRAFDFADPDTITGRRYVTTVPQQSLFFFNSPFVMQQACELVARPDFQALDATPKRVQNLYQQLFQRDPTDSEADLATRFLTAEPVETSTGATANGQRPMTAWERYAHVLLMSDELMFVD